MTELASTEISNGEVTLAIGRNLYGFTLSLTTLELDVYLTELNQEDLERIAGTCARAIEKSIKKEAEND